MKLRRSLSKKLTWGFIAVGLAWVGSILSLNYALRLDSDPSLLLGLVILVAYLEVYEKTIYAPARRKIKELQRIVNNPP